MSCAGWRPCRSAGLSVQGGVFAHPPPGMLRATSADVRPSPQALTSTLAAVVGVCSLVAMVFPRRRAGRGGVRGRSVRRAPSIESTRARLVRDGTTSRDDDRPGRLEGPRRPVLAFPPTGWSDRTHNARRSHQFDIYPQVSHRPTPPPPFVVVLLRGVIACGSYLTPLRDKSSRKVPHPSGSPLS